jgi:hypothetical protein
MSTATNLVNHGNAANTQIIEATVSGDSSSAVKLTNDGDLVLGNTTYHGSISSDNGAFHTDGSGNVTCNSITGGGTLSVTGNVTVAGTTTAGGARVGRATFFTGSISTIGGSVTVNHGFGSTPAYVYVIGTAQTCAYRVGSITSTTVTIMTDSGTGAFVAMAIG